MKKHNWIVFVLIGIVVLGAGALALTRPVAPPPPPTSTAAPAQTVSFAPALAKQDGKIRLSANGFSPGELVVFRAARQPGYARQTPGGATAAAARLTLAQARADKSGVAVAEKVTVPDEVTSGSHTLEAVGQASGRLASTVLYVQAKSPWMTLGTYSVKPGNDLGLIFGGLGPLAQVDLSIEPATQTASGGSQDPTKLSPPVSLLHVSTDRVGNATWIDLRLPLLKPGTYTVVAKAGDQATANVVVLALTPTIELSPWSGPPGSAVTFNARGFAAGDRVQVFVGQASQPALTVNADQYGNFWAAGPIHVPYGVNGGALPLRFVGLDSSAEVAAQFNVQSTKPWLELTAYSGPPGSPVGFSGGGWASNERITFHEGSDSGPEVAAGQADEYGWLHLSSMASVPGDPTSGGDPSASVTFVAVGEQSHATASATFKVINPFANLPPDLHQNPP